MTDAEIAQIIREDPYKIEINRGMKGAYGWTIKVSGKDKSTVLSEVSDIDAKLKQSFV